MGAGVAYVSAMSGIDVVLIDRDQKGADKGKAFTIEQQAKRVKRKKTTQEKADAIAARIEATTDYAKLKDVDIIVEAVFENSELKAKITKMTEDDHWRDGGVWLQYFDHSDLGFGQGVLAPRKFHRHSFL